VIRAAGSLGVDLVAIRGDISFPIEVKTSSYMTIHFSQSSGRAAQQAEELLDECRRSNVAPIYAFRLKGVRGADAWRIFTIEIEGMTGQQRRLNRTINKVHRTKSGNIALKWDEGMPLHKFIDYLC
jgi:Holliday junction resolvase